MSAPFQNRHIGPDDQQISDMLSVLKVKSLQELVERAAPKTILSEAELDLPEALGEAQFLAMAKEVAKQNKILKSYIGQGYYGTNTPGVIQRNILENPYWYTAYTPYQAEISQGRMEALLNFQTMIISLTGMEIANASLLDEGTAIAEAMAMAFNLQRKKDRNKIFVTENIFPQSLEVLQTRAEPLGIDVVVGPLSTYSPENEYFACLMQYPDSLGQVLDLEKICSDNGKNGVFNLVAADLLALTLLRPPGEWGADIVVGSCQRFGVPMGYGGPHAAYIATRDSHKRLMPGRIIGVSKDSDGRDALRLALQTREQHIRREKATSNICTAQVLLAVMASMYAVYHGPKGLQNIALKVHNLTSGLARGLKKLGFKLMSDCYFDTLAVEVAEEQKNTFVKKAESLGLNFNKTYKNKILISLDETTEKKDVEVLLSIFANQPQSIELPEAATTTWPKELNRTSTLLPHQIFNSFHSETEMLRYITRLQEKDLSLCHSMIPLGSCTMKLNSVTELQGVSWPEFSQLHPFAPESQTEGYKEMFRQLQSWLASTTGFAAVSLQPNAGSQGEFAGLLVIRKYLQDIGQQHRNICLIPSSAHGTNPASAVMAGMKVVVVKCDDKGNIDLENLKEKVSENKDHIAALMITYPSTHGVFEATLKDICKIVHDEGGQVYMDGANLNALVGISLPGQLGPDVCHLNLHKTFCIPHGGGGPGIGPIAVVEHLQEYLPGNKLVPSSGGKKSIGAIAAAPWGSAGILPISWAYMLMMGREGLKRATQVAILNANYIANRLEPYFPVLYKGQNGLVAHECIIDLRPLKTTSGITVDDVAKRLMDYGFHAPTMSWPVAGTLMIEPTESESLAELDRFCEAMIQIRKEISEVEDGQFSAEDNVLKNAPHCLEHMTASNWTHSYDREKAAYPLDWVRERKFWAPVGRVDNAYGDRNLVCSCPGLESYDS